MQNLQSKRRSRASCCGVRAFTVKHSFGEYAAAAPVVWVIASYRKEVRFSATRDKLSAADAPVARSS